MFLAKKSLSNYVGLYQKFLYKSFIITDTYPPKNSSRTSPGTMAVASGQMGTFLCAPQEAVTV